MRAFPRFPGAPAHPSVPLELLQLFYFWAPFIPSRLSIKIPGAWQPGKPPGAHRKRQSLRIQNYSGMRQWGGDVSLDFGWIMHPSVPAPSCSSQKNPRDHRGRNLGMFRDLTSFPFFPVFPVPSSFPFPSVLGYRAPSKENHSSFPAQIPTGFASQRSLEIQAHPLPLNPAGFKQIPGAVSMLIQISHPSEPGRNFSSGFMEKSQWEFPHHPQIPWEMRILEVGIRLEQGQG